MVSGTVGENGSVTLQADYADPDQDTGHLFFIEPNPTALGSIQITPTGQILYQNGDGFDHLQTGESRSERFTYRVTDEHGASATSHISITVQGQNDAPVAQAISRRLSEDAVSISLTPSFTDVDDTSGHQITFDDTDTTGLVSLGPGGIFTYTPNAQFDELQAGETAVDRFTYQVTDAHGSRDVQTVEITLTGVNDAPVTQSGSVEGLSNGVISFTLAYFDADDPSGLTLEFLDGFGDQPLGLTPVQSSADPGIWELRPQAIDEYQTLLAHESAQGTVTYAVTDPHGARSLGQVDVTIHGVNDAPTARDVNTVLEEGQGAEQGVKLSLSYSDIDTNDAHSFAFTLPDDFRGRLENHNDGTVTFYQDNAFAHLNDGETDQQTVQFQVTDLAGATASADLEITVEGRSQAAGITASVVTDGAGAQNLTYNMRSEVALKTSGGGYYVRPHSISDFDMDDAGNITAIVEQRGLAGVRGIIQVDLSGSEPVMTELTRDFDFAQPWATSGTSLYGISDHDISVSADGRKIAIITSGDGLLAGATWNQLAHIDLDTGEISQASSRSEGQLNANNGWGGTYRVRISDDGSKVIFPSGGAVPGIPDDNGGGDSIYLWDRDVAQDAAGRLRIVSTGETAAGEALQPNHLFARVSDDIASLSGDNRYAFFMTLSQEWTGESWQPHHINGRSIYRKDLSTGELLRLVGTEQAEPDLDVSHDGRYVSFQTYLSHDPNDTGAQDLYRLDTQTGALKAISARSDGSFTTDSGFHGFRDHEMSADGRFVVFTAQGGNLHSSSGAVSTTNVFLKDLLTGELLQLSQNIYGRSGTVGGGTAVHNTEAKISADGSLVAFISNAENYQSTFTENSFQWDSTDVIHLNVQAFKNALATHGAHGGVLNLAVDPSAYAIDTQIDAVVTWGDGGPQDITSFSSSAGSIALGHRFDLEPGTQVSGSATLALDGQPAFGQVDFAAHRVSYDDSLPTGDRQASLSGSETIDFMFGGHYTDHLSGGAGNDLLRGNGSDDTLLGGAGDDLIVGGHGADQLSGGAGKDHYVFSRLDDGGDVISDFEVANDTIVLSGPLATVFPNGLTDFSFVSATNPQPLLPFPSLTYDQSNGELAFDPDGTGVNDPVVLATLVGSPVLTLDNIEISNDL